MKSMFAEARRDVFGLFPDSPGRMAAEMRLGSGGPERFARQERVVSAAASLADKHAEVEVVMLPTVRDLQISSAAVLELASR